MIAIDWSHTKGLTIYDGKKVAVVDRKALLKKLAGQSTLYIQSMGGFNPASSGAGEESNDVFKSKRSVNSLAPLVILEQGCPLSLIYDILKTGSQVSTISNRATQDYRAEHSIEKSDENDAKIIYELASNGAKLTSISLDDTQIQLIDLYQRYKRYQKARVAMVNMKKAYVRHFGDGESSGLIKSSPFFNPSPAIEGEEESSLNVQSDSALNSSPTFPYDIGIVSLKAAENSCLKKIVKLAPPIPDNLKIKGLGPRLWAGIYITANPVNFLSLSSYLRYCGLVNIDQLNHKWNRHARMLYHMLADEIMKLRDERFRPIYDQCKADIAKKYPEYTKLHIHNAALNRTATFLAKEVFLNTRRVL